MSGAEQADIGAIKRLTREAGPFKARPTELTPAQCAGLLHFYKRCKTMSRRCDLLNTGPMSGNNVSHANNRTRRRFEVNLCNVTLASESLGQNFKLRVAAKTLRTVDFKGGLDAFLLGTKNHKLTDKAKKIKKAVAKKKEEVAAA